MPSNGTKVIIWKRKLLYRDGRYNKQGDIDRA